jgi:phenylacetate-CoA ligase
MAKSRLPRTRRHKSSGPGRPGATAPRRAGTVATTAKEAGLPLWPLLSGIREAQALALQFQFQQTEWWPPERLLAHQLRQVQALIDHAQATVPFYRERLNGVAGAPAGSLTLDRLREVPMLTRDDIRTAGTRLHSTHLPRAHMPTFPVRTSGSTGMPIEVQGTPMTGMMLEALTMRSHLWHRRDLTARNLTIRLPRRPGTDVKPGRWAPLPHTGPSYLLDISQPTASLFEQLLRHDPAYLQTHPGLVLDLLHISKRTGRRPGKLREVRTYGETLDPWLRGYCRDIWGVPMADNYSALELNTIALQCSESDNLHVQSENLLVEVIGADGRPCRPGQSGKLVATTLLNYATPLIRYDLGDTVEVGAPCPCGRGLPVLTRVVGRSVDLVELPSGERVFPMIYRELLAFPKIRQFQLVQTALDRLDLKLAVDAPLDGDEQRRVIEKVQKKLTYDFDVALTFVDDIPRAPSGKYHEFKSELPARAGSSS